MMTVISWLKTGIDFAWVHRAVFLSVVGTGVLGQGIRSAIKFIKRGKGERSGRHHPKILGPGVKGRIVTALRLVLDHRGPRIHSVLTDWGVFDRPAELDGIRRYFDDLKIKLIRENTHYLPGSALPLTSQPVVATGDSGRGPMPGLRRLRQRIRFELDPREGGDTMAPGRRSRVMRNVVSALSKATEPLVLLGDPGSGKTMTMRAVALTMIERETNRLFPSVIVYVRLSRLSPVKKASLDTIDDLISKSLPEHLRSQYSSFVENHRLVVLFDAMDEMPRRHYSDYVRALSDFGTRNAGTIKQLYSCRINDFSPEFRHRRLILLPFERRQILEYLRARMPTRTEIEGIQYTPREIYDELLRQQLPVQIDNPLSLFLITEYLNGSGQWPKSRAFLFESYIRRNYTNFMKHESESRRRTLGLEAALLLWGKAAYLLTYANKGTYLNVNELLDGDGKKAVEEGTYCGMLVQDEDEGGGFRFSHHRFQEYLTAWYMTKYPESEAIKSRPVNWLSALDEPRWQETVLNLAALSGPGEAVAALNGSLCGLGLHGFDDPSLGHSASPAVAEQRAGDRVELASRIIREVGRSPGTAGESLYPPTRKSVEFLIRTGNPITVVKMLDALRNLADPDFYSAAKAAFDSPVAWVRNQALLSAATIDAYRNEISDEFFLRMAVDVATARFLRRIPAYLRAAWLARAKVAMAQFGVAILALLIGVFASCALAVYSSLWSAGYGESSFLRDLAVDLDDEARVGQLVTVLTDFYFLSIPVVLLCSWWYFSWKRDVELQYVCLIAFLGYFCFLSSLFVLSSGSAPSVLIVLGLAEIAGIGCVLLAIPALLIHCCSLILYWALARVATGRVPSIVELMRYAMAETAPGTIVNASGIAIWRLKNVILSIIRNPRPIWMWTRSNPATAGKLAAVLIAMAVGIYILATFGDSAMNAAERARTNHPESFAFIGSSFAMLSGGIALVWLITKLFEPRLRRIYFDYLYPTSDIAKWSELMRGADPYLQAELLRRLDRQPFKILPSKLHDILVELEPHTRKEPSLSFYWIARQQVETVLRQTRGDRVL